MNRVNASLDLSLLLVAKEVASYEPLIEHFESPHRLLLKAADAPIEIPEDVNVVAVEWSEVTIPAITAMRARTHALGIPIIALCSPNPAEQVAALVLGADCIDVRPPSLISISARATAFWRAREAGFQGGMSLAAFNDSQPGSTVLHRGQLMLDVEQRTCSVEGRPLPLTAMEFRILTTLVREAPRVFTREELLESIWGLDFDPHTNVVDVHVSKIRKKLTACGLKDAIATVRGGGYRLSLK